MAHRQSTTNEGGVASSALCPRCRYELEGCRADGRRADLWLKAIEATVELSTIVREMLDHGQQARHKNYDRLASQFENCIFDPPAPMIPRYAALMEEFFDEQRVGVKIALCETEQEAFAVLGASVLDGYAPDGVYDLDVAEKIDIEVSTPIVTRAKVQGVSVNWLDE